MRLGIIRNNERGEAFCAGFNRNEVVILTDAAEPGQVHAQRYPTHGIATVRGNIPKASVMEVEDPVAYICELHKLASEQHESLIVASNQLHKLTDDYNNTQTLYQSALRLLELSTINK